jgi:hypothetical protein
MSSIKALTVAVLFIVGAGVAQAQEATPAASQGQTETVSRNADVSAKARYENSDIHSGYNVGPTQANVDHCVGPVSYCNIFFGS